MELKQLKTHHYLILKKIGLWATKKPDLRILDLGSGDSRLFIELLKKRPKVEYTGLELNPEAAARARKSFGNHPRVKIITGLANNENELADQFDVVTSLSVLEHVRHLESFLDFSAKKLKRGGRLIHAYDLGHAFYPSSWREWLKIRLCRWPMGKLLIPEKNWVSYVDEKQVVKILKKAGIQIKAITYHNSPSLNYLVKKLGNPAAEKMLDKLVDLELSLSPIVADLPQAVREPALPTVAIWGEKANQ